MLEFLKKMNKLHLIILAVFVVLAAGTAFQVVEAQASTCNICHEMKYFYDTYNNSTHPASSVTCIDCHTEPGVQGYVDQKVGAVKELVSHLTGEFVMPINTNLLISNAVCQKCHDGNLFGAVDHATHVSNGITCQNCHENVAHAGEGQSSVLPLNQCETCHQNHQSLPLTDTHGTLACDQCHTGNSFKGLSTTCTSCHNTQQHTTFPLTGAHTTTSCTDCHTQVSVKIQDATCSSCHTPPSEHVVIGNKTCVDCHSTIKWD